jgi:hypothetical protein
LPVLSTAKKSALADELTQYLATPVEATKDPLTWWVKKQATYPCLSRMARNYLSIPGLSFFYILSTSIDLISATSVDVERVFSKGRLVLSHVRNRLSVDSTRGLLCLGAWSKLGLINNHDIKIITSLPEVKKGEEEEKDIYDMVL